MLGSQYMETSSYFNVFLFISSFLLSLHLEAVQMAWTWVLQPLTGGEVSPCAGFAERWPGAIPIFSVIVYIIRSCRQNVCLIVSFPFRIGVAAVHAVWS